MSPAPGDRDDRDRPRIQVAVIGAGTCTPDEAAAASRAGRAIAREDAILICGGLAGVMEAACQGAREESGTTIGILPGTGGENPHLSIVIRTCLGHARNAVLVQSADAVIAIGGSYGTLSEIALALKEGREVFGFRSWELPGVVPCTTVEEAVTAACSAARRSRSYRSRPVLPGSP